VGPEPGMKRVLLGMLTPSSNTALEPLCAAMLRELPEVPVHFGRFRVTQIALSPQALGQFHLAPILQAARLLADAITWNGACCARRCAAPSRRAAKSHFLG